jgi:hypothetical protein
VFAPLYQAGLKFGDIGASAMRQGLFPQQADPALMKATAIQGVLSKYADQDTNSAEVLKKISADLRTIDPDASLRALEIANKLKPEGGKISLSASDLEKIAPEDRPRAIQAYQTTGKLPPDISFVDKPKNLNEALKFYTEYPEQATFKLQELSEQIERDPGNKETIRLYEQVAQAATRGAVDLFKKDEKTPEQRTREARINDLVKNRSISRSLATDIVDKNVEIIPNPATGMIQRIDKVSGSVTEVPISGLSPQDIGLLVAGAEEADSRTLWEAAELGTGLGSSIRAGVSRVVGQVGMPQAEETEEARTTLFTATNELTRSLVNNPRFPVAEVERVIKEVGTQPGAFDTPTLMRSRLKVLDSFLKDRLKTAEEDARNQALPQDLRSAQATNAAAIRAFLPKLGVPGSGEKPPKGITQNQWNAMSEDQRARFRK